MGPFGGGLAGRGDVCGVLIGALAGIGLRFSRGSREEKEDFRMWVASSIFINRFKSELAGGKLLCREISGVDDWRNEDQKKEYYTGEKHLFCRNLTGSAARILGELLEKYEEGK